MAEFDVEKIKMEAEDYWRSAVHWKKRAEAAEAKAEDFRAHLAATEKERDQYRGCLENDGGECYGWKLANERAEAAEAKLELAKAWLAEDDDWEAKMPDDWCTTRAAYRAREAFREAISPDPGKESADD